jgi:S1-C subfamily serine protease
MRSLLLAALLVGGFVWVTNHRMGYLGRWLDSNGAHSISWKGPDSARGAGLSSDELNNIEIYKKARLATVNITSTVYRRTWFLDVYPSRDIGSGFILDEQGHILTNSHVLQGGGRVQVTLENQEMYDARVLTRDRRNDLGLIQITPKKKLPYLNLGDSEHIQVGQKVLAIGNPFGLEGTLTTGIISSLGRTIKDEKGTQLEGMIQTDAAINPGNSGGPLLDSQGNVIAINTAIYGPGGNIGIGFAMPIARGKALVEDFKAGRSTARPRLGVSVVYVAGDLAEALDLPAQGGLLVQETAQGSAADAAGIRGARQLVAIGNVQLGVGGDLITAIDGRPANRNDAITRALAQKRPGDRLDLTIYRNRRSMQITVTLGEDPEDAL